ncbi:nucleoside recognition domain-containing protein [Curvivirga sp.]|uniref:nucleoside recognition domain-containing protein n=1 Tax=Curvivirga sp. TaxID=2856848 RepID=UPI003B5C6956
MSTALKVARDVVLESISLYWVLLKVMVPVMILVEFAIRLGIVEWVSWLCAPVMELVGLPAETAVVLATGLLVGIYGAAAALLPLLDTMEYSIASATILWTMLVIAHGLPVEQRIAQKAGCSFFFTSMLRLVSAFVLAGILNAIYTGFDFLQEPAQVIWAAEVQSDGSWLSWGINNAVSLFWVFWIILALMVLLKILEITGITNLLTKLLAPTLRIMGIGPNAAPLTMIGALLGLSFGGGLIIREVEKDHLKPKSIFLAICFMCLSHSLIEDTLIVMTLGADWTGVLLGRIVFSVLLMIPLGYVVLRMNEKQFRWFYSTPVSVKASKGS